jgi:uncharacterized RmlC-like cupin family protein
VLLHFKDDVDRSGHSETVAHHAKGLVNRWHGPLVELHVHSGTGDLNYVSNILSHKFSLSDQHSALSSQQLQNRRTRAEC